MKILVTGGAGYIGSVLVSHLLNEGYHVTVYDKFDFGVDPILPYLKNSNFDVFKGDIRDRNNINNFIKKSDVIIHLAAIVGYPACRKDPHLAKSVNFDGTKVISELTGKSQIIFYGSTGSNYGSTEDICTEETNLNPLSLYGQTKTMAENLLLEKNNCVAYRFATAFGISPRLRLDLLINDFSFRAITQGYVVVYESHFKRTFIHVDDIARSWIFALKNIEKMNKQIYNIGSENLNFSKKEICEKIKKKTSAYFYYADVGNDEDKRNYIVSYKKISKLGFDCKKTVNEGIDEIIKVAKLIQTRGQYSNA